MHASTYCVAERCNGIWPYQTLVRRQENRDASVDLADGKGDEHGDQQLWLRDQYRGRIQGVLLAASH